ncbi:MAG: tRNA-dihydrouridine synthase family protein [Spartobacteria bacterium]|nr:tRNA-dihydrouridine synthase family protein [Spartobacteria bacterium]
MTASISRQEPLSLILAPMRGLNPVVYRNAHHRHFTGLDKIIAPFIPTIKGHKGTGKLLQDILPERNELGDTTLVPQIIGNNPHDILALLDAIHDLGYRECNWNLGCPWPQVAKKRRGSGLLPHPDMIRDVLDVVCSKYPNEWSVKVRLGYKSNQELLPLLPLFNQYPLKEVIIHPRTAGQMYEGRADIEAFAACMPLISHPLVYNGDICSVNDFQRLRVRFPQINRWMVGRGLIIDPFLAGDIKQPGAFPGWNQRRQMLYDFYQTLLHEYLVWAQQAPSPVLGKMKEFWSYFSRNFDQGHKLFKKLKRTQTLSSFQSIVQEWFAAAPAPSPQRTDCNPLK